MTRLELQPAYLEQLKALLRQYVPEAEVWAFGSRVNGDGHETSDLDLVLRNPKDLSTPVSNLLDLKEALAESRLPILVDILDWARIPESFHQQILKAYYVIQQGDGEGTSGPGTLVTR